MSKEKAHRLLNSMEGSCFLVREDADCVGSVVLSVKSEGDISHFIINRGPGWYEVDGTGTAKRFELLQELVTYYQCNNLTDNPKVLLGTPFQTDSDLGMQFTVTSTVTSSIHIEIYSDNDPSYIIYSIPM